MFPFISKNLLSNWSFRIFLTLSNFWLFSQSKETTFGLLITFVFVSKQYLSMSSLSPENQPPSLPPDLTALVLILFDVGGVDSMIVEKEAKGLTQREQEMLQEMTQLIVFVRENSCTRIYRNVEPYYNQLMWVGFSLQREKTWPRPAQKTSEKAENYMVITCDLWLVIKALEFSRLWNIFLYDML